MSSSDADVVRDGDLRGVRVGEAVTSEVNESVSEPVLLAVRDAVAVPLSVSDCDSDIVIELDVVCVGVLVAVADAVCVAVWRDFVALRLPLARVTVHELDVDAVGCVADTEVLVCVTVLEPVAVWDTVCDPGVRVNLTDFEIV